MTDQRANMPSRGSLWFAVLAAPVGWALQEALGWFLASAPCERYSATHAWVGRVGGWQLTLHVFVILLGFTGLLFGIRGWRRTRDRPAAEITDVDHFLAVAGTVISAVGLAALVWGTLGTWLLPSCEVMR
ncbi:hypothetical protein ACO2Q2_09635 [Dyella sp. KRB-257]|uniref:hypothetical protein n=1 Tax=Dyella sp. KRB-257 TaxID=3400915 RepID=UPI003C0F81CB